MNFKFWMTIALIPVLIQCTNNNTKVEQKFEPLDSIAFNQTLIDLGEKLFFDPRLSINNTVSCASCHHPDKAFTDGKKRSIGIHQREKKCSFAVECEKPRPYDVGWRRKILRTSGNRSTSGYQ